jgi:hypothetical protein
LFFVLLLAADVVPPVDEEANTTDAVEQCGCVWLLATAASEAFFICVFVDGVECNEPADRCSVGRRCSLSNGSRIYLTSCLESVCCVHVSSCRTDRMDEAALYPRITGVTRRLMIDLSELLVEDYFMAICYQAA